MHSVAPPQIPDRKMQTMSRLVAFAFTTLLALPSTAQDIEDPGVHPVGWRDVSFTHPLAANPIVLGRVYYPALTAGQDTAPDPSAGPYPVSAFLHGLNLSPDDYDELCIHAASWGFIVASNGTETGFGMNVVKQGMDTRALLHWVEAEGANPQSFLSGMPAGAPWSAVGHSAGGRGLFELIAIESSVRHAAGLESFWPGPLGTLGQFDGDLLIVAAADDGVTPPQTNARLYYSGATGVLRRSYFELATGGHFGCTDGVAGTDTHRLHRRSVTGFLRAEARGEEGLYSDILGPGIVGEAVSVETLCDDPILWISNEPGSILRTGMTGIPLDSGIAVVGVQSASIMTPFGTLGVLPLRRFPATIFGGTGIIGWDIPYPPSMSGQTALVQGVKLDGTGGVFTRVATLVLQ